jgi:hypothetical protein
VLSWIAFPCKIVPLLGTSASGIPPLGTRVYIPVVIMFWMPGWAIWGTPTARPNMPTCRGTSQPSGSMSSARCRQLCLSEVGREGDANSTTTARRGLSNQGICNWRSGRSVMPGRICLDYRSAASPWRADPRQSVSLPRQQCGTPHAPDAVKCQQRPTNTQSHDLRHPRRRRHRHDDEWSEANVQTLPGTH